MPLHPHIILFLILFLSAFAALSAFPARAEVHFTQPRDNWYQSALLRLTAFKTGESDCLLLECGGQAMMIDGGGEKWREETRDALIARGVTGFTYLLSTHDHEDHIGGLIWLMRYGFHADAFLTPYAQTAEVSSLQAQALKAAEAAGIPVITVGHMDELFLGEAMIVLLRHEDGINVNARSLVARVDFGNASLLLTADIVGLTQRWLLAECPALLDVDVLKAPHHGITAVVGEFLDEASPLAPLVTNTQSRANVRAQATSRNLPVYYSGNAGVVFETDGQDWYIYQLP